MDTQRRLEAGFYDPSNYTTNYHIYNDHSVGDTTISAAEGAHVMIENRTGANSGTNTYAVGSVTTSTSTIVIDGDGNIIDIAASSSSTGCQDGSISMTMNQIFDTIDISSGASGSFSSSTSRTTGGCND